jgi:superfamily II helicase
LDEELDELHQQKLISIGGNGGLHGTQLGRAIVTSSLSPRKGIRVYNDLDNAMRSICLDSELHMLFLVSYTQSVACL